MRKLTLLFFALALAAGAGSAARAADAYKVPRTKFGQPDFQGVWTNTSLTWLVRPPIFKGLIATPQEEATMLAGFRQMAGDLLADRVDPDLPAPPPVKSAPQADILEMDLKLARIDGQPRSSWIVEPADGKPPLTAAGQAATAAAEKSKGYADPEARPNEERCLTSIGLIEGPPMMNGGFNSHYQIVQTRDHVAIYVEMNHDVRIIRLTDHRRPSPAIAPWMGDSIGWWEGDTLVVETTNLNPKGAYVGGLTGGFAYSAQAKVIERFTRKAKDMFLYEFTVVDPVTFSRPWRGEMPFRTAPGPIYEYACHEGNYSLPNILQGARVQEAEAARAAAAKPAAP
ncbi:MAG: hypothetical protein JNL41_11575 [Phenylobacterium sp.]|uniref:hypothetical protein n=1 Tax=Phenylobacterium sp. TaxID=1871053 RepID=UPI001A46C17B|nr:hypothetical protein [Phenylobacterium sp.]MBL8554909.1 hypothetical protein [Phenylobacterium sp.]